MSFARSWLMLQWCCARLGTVRAITALLCIAAISAGVILAPQLRLQAKADQRALAVAASRLQSTAQIGVVTQAPLQDRLADFYDALGDNGHAEQQLSTLFDLAQKNNLRLATAEYTSTEDKNSRVHVRHITLPVKASYSAIRQFAEHVLLAIPFASLDELHFKRDSISSPMLEAHLQFSLYLLEMPAPPGLHRESTP